MDTVTAGVALPKSGSQVGPVPTGQLGKRTRLAGGNRPYG